MQISRFLPVVAIALAMPSGSRAQTQLDLRTQAKSVDFSNAVSTRPFKTGTSLPATCVVGEAFFKTNATAGQNWFGCVSSNTWTQQSGTGSSGLTGYIVVPFSASPVFTAPGIHATTFLLLLSGDVNGSSLSGASAGDSLTFRICQDEAGGHVFTWPTNIQGASPINQTGNACTSQTFVFDGTKAQAVSSASITGIPGGTITMPGSTSGITTLQPSAVAAGTLTLPARTATVATTVGSSTANDCVKFDASGNLVDAGAACGSGSGGGTGGSMFSTSGTGQFWPFGIPQTSGSSVLDSGLGPNKVVYWEFSIPASFTVRSMSWFQGTNNASKHYTWGIYDSTFALVNNAQCGTVTSAGNSVQSCQFAGDVNLWAGTYYLAFSSDEDGTVTSLSIYSSPDGSFIAANVLGSLSVKRIFSGSTPSTGTATITLPGSFASDSRSVRAYEPLPAVVLVP